MTNIKLRPQKHYKVEELADILQVSNLELLRMVDAHKINFCFVDDDMVFLGQDIQQLIDKLSCTHPDSP